MMIYTLKLLISAGMIVLISEVAKKYPELGGMLASLPIVSILGMTWLWLDTHDAKLLATHSLATFWFVLPSLPMFVLLPWLLRKGVSFWGAMLVGCLLTIGLYWSTMLLIRRWE